MLEGVRAPIRRAYRRALSHERVWRRELPTEVEFWQKWLRTGGLQWPSSFRERLDPVAPLREPLIADRLAAIPRDPVEILDVGAGPLTALGKTHPARTLAITAVDPLGAEYDRLLAEAGITPLVRTQRCRGEELAARFAPASFDVAYARNALDHSADPARIIGAMLALVRPDGFVALRHYRNEATVERYEELHQWNFDVDDGDHLVVWSPRERHDLTAELAGRADVSCAIEGGSDHAPYVTAVLTPR